MADMPLLRPDQFMVMFPWFAAISQSCTRGVLFTHASIRTAVEVKSHISPRADIVRGLFQCVKYRAVLNAWIAAENGDGIGEAVLVLEDGFPKDLHGLRNTLDMKVIDHIRVPELAHPLGGAS